MRRGAWLLLAVVGSVTAMAIWVSTGLLASGVRIAPQDRARIDVLPLPTELALGTEELALGGGLRMEATGHVEPRLARALDRADLPRAAAGSDGGAELRVEVAVEADEGDPVRIDESYALDVGADGARLRSLTTVGALRGLQTLHQLVRGAGDAATLPSVRVRDAPRFPWRGVELDVARDGASAAAIASILNAMEPLKLNVLHLRGATHLLSDAGIRKLVWRARQGGIRVVPEIDARSAADGAAVAALAALFPDPWVHVGGASQDAASLRRAHESLAAHGRRMIAPEEGLAARLPRDVAIRAGLGSPALAAAVAAGHEVLVVAGAPPAGGDPARVSSIPGDPARAASIDRALAAVPAERRHAVLGGEIEVDGSGGATLGPAVAVFAERLWSPADATDDERDLARRLEARAARPGQGGAGPANGI